MKAIIKAIFKPVIITTIVFIIGSLISILIKFKASEFLLSTFFTVSGIMFSVGIGLIATFNMNGLKNPEIIKNIRHGLSNVRNMFIVYFTVTTISLIFGKLLIDKEINSIHVIGLSIDISFSICFTMLFCIAYFIYNFFQLQRLSDEIYDNLNK